MVFSAVLCTECGEVAKALQHRLEQALVASQRNLPTLLQHAILRKDLRYGGADSVDEAGLRELLELLVSWMKDQLECQSPTPTEAPSSQTLKLPAPIVGER